MYKSPRKNSAAASMPALRARNLFGRASPVHETYQSTALTIESRRLLSPREAPRRIPRDPIKVLDAPGIRDDYYLNLMDWASSDRVAVALDTAVYIWDAATSTTTELCDVGTGDWVTSVGWAENGKHLAVGLNSGTVQIWDANKSRRIRTLAGHARRVGAVHWNGSVVSTASRDKRILNFDTRMRQNALTSTYYGHTQEVCGVRWSPCGTQLASGGNDNLLLVWDTRFTPMDARASVHPDISPGPRGFRRPLFRLTAHGAAVKALAWSPAQSMVLASGGGSDDRCIRVWDTRAGRQLVAHDTKSQVCNLSWSHDGNEIVSTHGYSENHVVVWKYPLMQPVSVLTGHTKRVLYLAHSPDGQTIATAAGDETIRFWDVFPKHSASSRMPSKKGQYLARTYERGDPGHDDFSRLNRALKRSGLYCKDMTGDGNCLFRALADQVDGTPDTHLRHRESVCDYMHQHTDDFEPFIDSAQPYPRYVAHMRRPGEYGGNLELVAFARNYRVDIKVYQLGGTVFVISGAPPSNPDDPHRSMPPVHIAYHSYEHYSSVRNKHGPHNGLPKVKERVKVKGFSRVLGFEQSVAPSCPSEDSEEEEEEEEECLDGPTSMEKMIMGSTGVSNCKLIRRLLDENFGDEGKVVEMLVQWMAEDAESEPWWAEDGPIDYNGPISEPIKEPIDEHIDEPNDESINEPTHDPEPTIPEPIQQDAEPPNHAKPKPVKGAARKRKAESKKRQKESAKLKKRQAAREASSDIAKDTTDVTLQMNHIYI
ncbi:Fizzy- protein [Coemansia sp. RSA 518]|nr:Fizzy- protein [Coemansia sp. RSA 518]